MTTHLRPVILLLFANDRAGADPAYLRNLPAEARRLQRRLQAVADGFSIVALGNITRASLFDALRQYGGRTVGVHFAGHADPDAIYIEDEAGHPEPLDTAGLAGRLAAMENLRWVFLNGCATEGHVEALHARVAVPTIATVRVIADAAAVEFADEFYAGLTSGRTLAESFAAAGDRMASHGGPGRHRLLRPGASAPDDRLPWILAAPPALPDAVHWTLRDAAIDVASPLLARWRAHLRRHHARLVPFFEGADGAALIEKIYIDLALDVDGSPAANAGLRGLMAGSPDRPPGRWAVLGDPGAGKSTLARHLVWTLAGQDGPTPVYVPLSRWAGFEGDPFDHAEAELLAHGPREDGLDLAAALRGQARERDAVWVLLDGFDEIPQDAVASTRERIESFAGRWPTVAVAVLSRPVGYSPLADFTPVRIRPLDPLRQRSLLGRWLDGAAAGAGTRLAERISAAPALRAAAGNPLLLSLIALVAREHPHTALPDSRGALFGRAVELLLARGHGLGQCGIEPRHDARLVLRALSLRLTAEGSDRWTFEDLDGHLEALCPPDSLLGRKLTRGWTAPGAFLRAVAEETGIIGPHDGPGRPWRYLHRSLRERLAAEALAHAPDADADIARRAQAIADDPDALGQWGETLGVACTLLDAPAAPLRRIRDADPRLALRLLPELRGLEPHTALSVLFDIDCCGGRDARYTPDSQGWSGDDLLALATPWSAPSDLLWPWVTPTRTLDELAFLHYALEALGPPVDRRAFFGAVGRPPPAEDPRAVMIRVPPGTFCMGSRDDEQERWADEHPRHTVRITRGLWLGRAPVTRARYAAFDPDHACPGGPQHPVVEISWWRARLFAAWVGARLPTEAEWEYACRAGTDGRYWAGETEADLRAVAWYGEDPFGTARPVATKPANPWGLHDVHGNVWEWTADWMGEYADAPRTDPRGPPAGEQRVLRGGAYVNDARSARSACRSWWHPASQLRWLGLRLAADVDDRQPAADDRA